MKKCKLLFAVLMSVMMMVTFIPCMGFAASNDIGDAEVYGLADEVYTWGAPGTEGYTQVLDDISVVDDGATLTYGEDYTVEYKNNMSATKDAKMIFKGIGAYSGTLAMNYAIVKAPQHIYGDFSASSVKVGKTITLKIIEGTSAVTSANIGTINVTGDGKYLEVIDKGRHQVDDGLTDPYWEDQYQVRGLKDGQGKVKITAGGDQYFDSGSKTFSIKVVGGQIVASAITLSKTSYTYDGNAKKPSVTVKISGKKLKKGTDFTVKYSNNKNASTSALVTVTGKGNYSGTAEKHFTIKKAAQKISVTGYTTTLKPNGTSTKIKQTAAKATTNVGEFTYESSNTNVIKVKRDANHNCEVIPKNAGTATVKITAKGTSNLKQATQKITFTVKAESEKKKISQDMILFTYKSGNKYKELTNPPRTCHKGEYPDITLFPNKAARDKMYNSSIKDPSKYTGKLIWNTDWAYQYDHSKGKVTIWGKGQYKGTIVNYYKYDPTPRKGEIDDLLDMLFE